MSFLKEYTLLGELGTGGFAKVYKVRHNELGYIRAIRVLNEPITDENSHTYQKFLRECKVLLRLGNGSQSNIVHIYQPRLLENHALVEMDYVDGKDIAHYLQDNGNFLPVEEVLRMAKEMSGALAYCHEDIYKFCMDPDEDNLDSDPIDGTKFLINDATKQRLIEKYKVIHNDIHSGNIMRREDGSFVLLDFGLAITGGDDVRNSSRHDNGAIEFKAPEKWDDDALLTEQSDIYSFGVVMYEYLAGRVPFPYDQSIPNRTEAAFKVCKAHKEQLPPSIFDLRKANYEAKHPCQTYVKDYPDWLEEAIMRCLKKDPAKRFHNGKELHGFVRRHIEEANGEALPLRQESLAEQKPDEGHVDNEYLTVLDEELQLSRERLEGKQTENEELRDELQRLRNQTKPSDSSGRKYKPWLWLVALLLAMGAAYYVYQNYYQKRGGQEIVVTREWTIDYIQTYHNAIKQGDYERVAAYFAPRVNRYFNQMNITREDVINLMKKSPYDDRDVSWDYEWNTLNITDGINGEKEIVFSCVFHRKSGKGKGVFNITTNMILDSEGQILSIYDSKTEKVNQSFPKNNNIKENTISTKEELSTKSKEELQIHNNKESSNNVGPSEQHQTSESNESLVTQKEDPAVEKPKSTKPKQETKPAEEPKPTVNKRALFKGNDDPQSGGSEGITGQPCDQGKPDGMKGIKQYDGNGGIGNSTSYELGGRGAKSLHRPSDVFSEDGRSVVDIWVNRAGQVVRAEVATKGTDIVNNEMRQRAIQSAKRSSFASDPDAPEEQHGTITYIFRFIRN